MKIPFHLTTGPFSRFRTYEWFWRSPMSELPLRQRLYRLLDPIFFGQFSRLELDEARRKSSGKRNTSVFFAWVCSSIEINNKFAEAYVWRSISGNELYCRFGKMQRLQGWDRSGEELYYDVDCAMVDALIAAALRPDWDWTIRASGVMASVKAIRLVEDQKDSEESKLWLDYARLQLQTAVKLAEKVKHSELVDKTKDLISDIDYWAKHGDLPQDSELGELRR